VAVGDGELHDVAVRRRAVDRRAIGIRDGRDVRDARRPGPAVVVRRREAPEDGTVVGVDSDRLAVRRRDEEDVVGGAVDLHVMEIDGRRVDGAVDRHLLAPERGNGRRGETDVGVRGIRAGFVVAEARPVVAILHDGRRRVRITGVDRLRTMRISAGEEGEAEQVGGARHGDPG